MGTPYKQKSATAGRLADCSKASPPVRFICLLLSKMHFDPKIQNLLITVYCFLLMSSLLCRFRWATPTPWNLLGYALEFTGLRPGIYY